MTDDIDVQEAERKVAAKKRCAEAGYRNLLAWKSKQPHGHAEPCLRHGAYSTNVRKRYSDKRTSEGQRLQKVIDSLVADLGGPTAVNSAQTLILASLRSKLAVIWQIGDWVDKQESVITPDGNLLNVLGRNFLSFCESARRDLEVLFAVSRRGKGAKIPSLEEVIARSKECAS